MKHMKHGLEKRREAKSRKKRNLIIALIAILIIVVSIIFYIVFSQEADLKEITDFEYPDQNTIEEPPITEEPEEPETEPGVEIVDVSDMPTKANGFNVIGKIVLEKIGIQCYIFGTSSKEERLRALEVGTVRFRGPEQVNEPR